MAVLLHARRGMHPLRRSCPKWRVWAWRGLRRWLLPRAQKAGIALQGMTSLLSLLLALPQRAWGEQVPVPLLQHAGRSTLCLCHHLINV